MELKATDGAGWRWSPSYGSHQATGASELRMKCEVWEGFSPAVLVMVIQRVWTQKEASRWGVARKSPHLCQSDPGFTQREEKDRLLCQYSSQTCVWFSPGRAEVAGGGGIGLHGN